ncbi:MAG: PilZ domain-containing protein [Planctomycetota bacterium]|nr:PilZ domain-containing protein [Planctomycetota bacterium]
MEAEQERRRHDRLPMKLTVICQKVGTPGGSLYSGNTVNVSPGGMLMEVNGHGLSEGSLVSVDMSIPETGQFGECGGRLNSYARVIRVDKSDSRHPDRNPGCAQTVALEFCDGSNLRI